jgi:hypothetical protein
MKGYPLPSRALPVFWHACLAPRRIPGISVPNNIIGCRKQLGLASSIDMLEIAQGHRSVRSYARMMCCNRKCILIDIRIIIAPFSLRIIVRAQKIVAVKMFLLIII